MDYMKLAIAEGKKCKIDVPCGAVIVMNDKVIARAHNKKEKSKIATNHAEIIAINKACKKIKDYRLNGAIMYVTKEPCIMCMGAILSARIDKVIYGVKDIKYSNLQLIDNVNFNHKTLFELDKNNEVECKKLLQDFFKKLRSKNK